MLVWISQLNWQDILSLTRQLSPPPTLPLLPLLQAKQMSLVINTPLKQHNRGGKIPLTEAIQSVRMKLRTSADKHNCHYFIFASKHCAVIGEGNFIWL